MLKISSHPLVAVVTPYHREDTATLERCLDSVARQSYDHVLHFFVADGYPRADLVEGRASVRHVVLPNEHGDNGDTPRGIGAICALNAGAGIACFLDADNFYESEHVLSVVDAFDAVGGDVVFSDRYIMPRGHSDLRVVDPEDNFGTHVDTSCISLAASAAFLWPLWAMIPNALSPVCDRIITFLIRHYGLRCTRTSRRTVVFDSNYRHHFRLAGLPAPDLPHEPDIDKIRAGYDPTESYARLRIALTI